MRVPQWVRWWLRADWFKLALLCLAAVCVVGYWDYLRVRKWALRQEAHRANMLHRAELELQRREYLARRRAECYAIYEREQAQRGNADGVEYDEERDRCMVRYQAVDGEWQDVDCAEYYQRWEAAQAGTLLKDSHLEAYRNCSTNTLTRKF